MSRNSSHPSFSSRASSKPIAAVVLRVFSTRRVTEPLGYARPAPSVAPARVQCAQTRSVRPALSDPGTSSTRVPINRLCRTAEK